MFHKDDAKLDFLDVAEHFIPLRVDIILEKMLSENELPSNEHESFKTFRKLLGDRFHYEYHAILETLKNDFVPFDPDRETVCEPEYTTEELYHKRNEIYNGIKRLLEIGNFRRLSDEQLVECLKLQPLGGLSVHVDTSEFDEFQVYYRGVKKETVTDKYFHFFRNDREVEIMSRVFVLAKFKVENGGMVVAKLFKEVPVENIKIIAPKVKLGMPVFDRVKIGGTVFGSLFTTIYKLIAAAALSWVVFGIVLGGLLLAAFKGVMSFMSSQTKYLHVFSSSLYYRSLSNNKAAITDLVDSAEEQEVKETLLSYYILHIRRDLDMTMEELDTEIESWIKNKFGFDLDFEIDDAARKLAEKNLLRIIEIPSQNDLTQSRTVLKVYDLAESLRRFDEAWDGFYSCEDNMSV